ncbi:MAG: hypothetical protein KC549_11605, partial [Myxococcales bacterium]|nr:hypothetical protein [Myxococcales bacterium]
TADATRAAGRATRATARVHGRAISQPAIEVARRAIAAWVTPQEHGRQQPAPTHVVYLPALCRPA